MKAAKNAAYTAMAAVIITVCSWLTVPFTVPFTMQTFAVFCVLLILGGKRGTAATVLYILLGMAGLPVFSGFNGGFAHVIGPTGGYMIGFVLIGILYTVFEPVTRDRGITPKILVLSGGLLLCYITGTVWFVAVYGARGESMGFFTALSVCVLPYIIPDIAKMALAFLVGERVKKYIK